MFFYVMTESTVVVVWLSIPLSSKSWSLSFNLTFTVCAFTLMSFKQLQFVSADFSNSEIMLQTFNFSLSSCNTLSGRSSVMGVASFAKLSAGSLKSLSYVFLKLLGNIIDFV